MPYEPIIPKGQHLGNSHDVDGAATGHLFENGTNKLKGHAAWEWVDEKPAYEADYRPEPPRELTAEEIEQAIELAGIIVAGILRGVAVATPRVKHWWNSRAVPLGKSAWRRVTSPGKKKNWKSLQDGPASFAEEAMFVASKTGLELAPARNEIRMSIAEWESRFRSMLSADVFAQDQMRVLSIARVDEEQAVVEQPSRAEELTPYQFVERVRLMLEANPALLSEKTSAELMQAFYPRAKPQRAKSRTSQISERKVDRTT